MIEKIGYRTLIAKNGKEAIEITSSNNNIDLVILDLTMPIMSGGETLAEIKKINSDLPVIISSGYSEDELEGMGDQEVLSTKKYQNHHI